MPNPNDRYVAVKEIFLRAEPKPKGEEINHLLLGDWVRITGAEANGWTPVRARGDDGFLPSASLTTTRPLEVNFVDIGQGDGCHIVTPDDRVMLIDAGISDNMARFLSWRYNLRGRKVAGVDGVAASDPDAKPAIALHTVIMSHPDEDHYGGFTPIFANGKLKVERIFHNGIVERPIADADKLPGLTYASKEDIGGYVSVGGKQFLWETIETDAEMKAMLARHPTTTKRLLTAFRTAAKNNPAVEITSLSVENGKLPGFDAPDLPELHILGPVGKQATFQGQNRYCLPKLGDEGETKNGHSIVFRMTFGKLSVLLGGDLNTASENHLLREHLDLDFDITHSWSEIQALKRKGMQRTAAETSEMNTKIAKLDAIVEEGRAIFRVDVAKACHHGSHHFTEPFLQMLDATATVISSGDNESYAHPRPDAIGAFGKYGRGIRPLIFSTELARSVRESSPLARYITIIDGFRERIATATSAAQKKAIQKEMDEYRDRHVAVYGMVTLRTDGNLAVIAQKLESPNGAIKWDIHPLVWNDDIGEFEYIPKGSH